MSGLDHENQGLGASIVITTLPDDESFEALARSLLSQRLIACANGLPGARAIYRWQGDIETASETLALFKTRTGLVEQVTDAIRREHPYELPEVVAVPVTGGLADYIAWIEKVTQSAGS